MNLGIYRCGWCNKLGHNRRSCKTAPKRRHANWSAANAGYSDNRTAKRCDDCGQRTTKSRCTRCSARRKRWPSRQAAYRLQHEKRRR